MVNNLDMVNNLKFRKSFGNTFQNELKEVIQDIKKSWYQRTKQETGTN